ncbi:YaiI/YqxD family protein [bacterium]|nr:MAG: YaiI/YqxD family protein [bacterium]
MLDVYVDADGCPVKEEIYKVARRHNLAVFVVSNRHIHIPHEEKIRLVVVKNTFDAVDDYIAQNVKVNDIAVTADLLLAQRCIKAGAVVLNPKGRELDEESIGSALAMRELLDHLRQTGENTGGPAPMAGRDRSEFLRSFHEVVERIKRG